MLGCLLVLDIRIPINPFIVFPFRYDHQPSNNTSGSFATAIQDMRFSSSGHSGINPFRLRSTTLRILARLGSYLRSRYLTPLYRAGTYNPKTAKSREEKRRSANLNQGSGGGMVGTCFY